ncbi:nuclear transport factor 2 family protein [Parvibaculum sp.]|uniref:nuclear transport factor 2 family protein n=1 Tax=Parvibaculum sp. TaxID=2024848 RepID=UPI002C26DAB5|nr:nuclear transport factor 2 family protein [Parvibaculum sp.]HUD51063.1 nuclear transport factor 2 family protein [Parvibaculum sp.]
MTDALKGWHEVALHRDFDAIDGLLAEDVIFESPIVHTPQVGKAITAMYLNAAVHVLGNDSFRFVGEWKSERSGVLEFMGEVDGIKINGVDMIHWNEAGLITHFKVMVRPLKAVNMLHRKMGEMLAATG